MTADSERLTGSRLMKLGPARLGPTRPREISRRLGSETVGAFWTLSTTGRWGRRRRRNGIPLINFNQFMTFVDSIKAPQLRPEGDALRR